MFELATKTVVNFSNKQLEEFTTSMITTIIFVSFLVSLGTIALVKLIKNLFKKIQKTNKSITCECNNNSVAQVEQ
ncbi:Uncharacterised protein [Mycoplasmopsis citelli]|uniref:Uncharacterized protein n=1 Tax=Mycoplasmopsis citelli TaxID=171281 RepID=A0A449B2I2_9BACT|nr:hypothetical protein [Mycoplasmopsis citelli]VEU74817.1 Uncharacterised protein [Mycoplasmopsis citelli]